jgi:hypothetical protein
MTVAACVTPVDAITAVPPAVRADISFASVDVALDEALSEYARLDGAVLSQGLLDEFRLGAAERPGGSNGAYAVTTEIEILSYREPNAALAIALGDSAEISGYVRLRTVSDQVLVGEYFVSVIEGAGGLLGLAMADANEPELAREFVEKFFTTFDREERVAEN